MHVLVPLDGSRLSDAVVSHLRRLVQGAAEACEVHLLHVVEPTDRRLEARAAARTHLAAFESLLASDGFKVHSRVVVGDPVLSIVERAVDEGVHLVAMATHGRSGIKRWMFGSVAERVVRACPLPVLLVNPRGLLLTSDDIRYHRILASVDATLPLEVLGPVATLAAASAAEVVLVDVGLNRSAGLSSPHADRCRHWLETHGVKAVRLAEGRGDAAEAILGAASTLEADLIAVSAGPRTWLSPWSLEGVVQQVARRARCPVLILRGPAVAAPTRAAGIAPVARP